MSLPTPKTIFRKDYTSPDYLINQVALEFQLGEEESIVTSRLTIHRNRAIAHSDANPPLVLDGRGLVLDSITMDGRPLAADRYTVEDEHLTLSGVPAHCTLTIVTRIRPQENTTLEGLYRSGGNFCTQCEAEGFRKITYFLDRPDVLARYTTTIIADQTRYPVLLSNGNAMQRGQLDGNRHWVRWEDPFPKPCYLFALVAGDLVCFPDRFTTRSGREVTLSLYVQQHNIDKCQHAMASLKKAMAWDEETFGLEYDLDECMIVAVDDFNMGAMENKGLNIFNSRYVLAKPETATDDDYSAIEEVIAHEYFHNWTGNRVTCRDWFQLSLKEGLTVFRDQEFSADQVARSIKRIQDVRILRENQFAEDGGPIAHSVRPESYMEISNFYTVTIYNKGAEVIRMLQALLGKAGFLRGIARYIQDHDGQAATIEDFVLAMEKTNDMDLSQFRRWYAQAGTPEVSAVGEYDAEQKTYTLTLHQSCPPTPGQPEKHPFHIPLGLGLLDESGQDLPLVLAGDPPAEAENRTRVLSLRTSEQAFRFTHVPVAPVPSLLRGFSAPINLKIERSHEELAFLLAHDSDPFARWDAGQTLASRLMLDSIATHQAGKEIRLPRLFIKALEKTLSDGRSERALIAEILTLPTEIYLGMQMECIDPEAIHQAWTSTRRALAEALEELLLDTYYTHRNDGPYRYDPELAGRRRLKNVCLGYLMELDKPDIRGLCLSQFHQADNMTDALAALTWLANTDCSERLQALAAFEERWHHDPLVLDKWFSVQATARLADTLQLVEQLMTHSAFFLKKPNKVRALIGAFCQRNQVRFHRSDGAGYRFLADQVLALDAMNPQIAARLLGAMNRWRAFDAIRQQAMSGEIQRILAEPNLSRDTREIGLKMMG